MSSVVKTSMVGSGQSNVEKYEAHETLHLERSWLLMVVGGCCWLVVGLYWSPH